MDSKIFIIHSASIVQYGLIGILKRYFKCIIESFESFEDFKKSKLNLSHHSILLTEDIIANRDDYIKFITANRNIVSYNVVNCANKNNVQDNVFTIHIHYTENEIYEKIKTEFIQKQVEKDNRDLSTREIDVLKLVAKGFANKEIAEKLFISTHTIMSHRKKITEKLGIKSRSGLTVYAIINSYINTKNIDISDLI